MKTRIYPTIFIALMGLPVAAAAAPIPDYETEVWEAARTLVWSKPGVDGDVADPQNYTNRATGKTAVAPPDRATDVILPAAEALYQVKGDFSTAVRHLTIERNAEIRGRHRREIEIWGNLWVKEGGWVQYVSIRGPKHTFFKIDNADYPTAENGDEYFHPSRGSGTPSRSQISHKFQVAKYGDASVEFIGNLGVSDEVMLQHGKLIVSGEFRWSGYTNKGAMEIYDGGILELQSGGAVASFKNENNKDVYNLSVYRNGTIQAGSPERPITSDAYVYLGYGDNTTPGHTGLFMAAGSRIRVYSADPKTARLVFTSVTSRDNFHEGRGKKLSNPGAKADGVHGIFFQLAGDTDFNGVHFDYVSEGGIGLADVASRAEWKNVTYGENNAAAPSGLYSQMTTDANVYYHDRGSDQKSEFALTNTAVKSMQAYLKSEDKLNLSFSPENVTAKQLGEGEEAFTTPISILFESAIDVEISCAQSDAPVYYTLDGSEPTANSTRYAGPFSVDRTIEVKAKAIKSSSEESLTYSKAYVFK